MDKSDGDYDTMKEQHPFKVKFQGKQESVAGGWSPRW